MKVILHDLYSQEYWRCAWEAIAEFRLSDPNQRRFGRDQAVTYTFEIIEGDGPREIQLTVWRSKHAFEVVASKSIE